MGTQEFAPRRPENDYRISHGCHLSLRTGPDRGEMENTLRSWMQLPPGVAKPIKSQIGSPYMEQMLRDLVYDDSDWQVYVMGHYGLLINSMTVDLIQQPVLVRVYDDHPHRVAMKFHIAPRVESVEKPDPTEIWNLHSPTKKKNHGKLGHDARVGIFETISAGDARRIVGGDLNMSTFETYNLNTQLPFRSQFQIYEQSIRKHGDLYLTRHAETEHVDMTIGQTYTSKDEKSSDNHNACGLILMTPVNTSVPKYAPDTSSVSAPPATKSAPSLAPIPIALTTNIPPRPRSSKCIVLSGQKPGPVIPTVLAAVPPKSTHSITESAPTTAPKRICLPVADSPPSLATTHICVAKPDTADYAQVDTNLVSAITLGYPMWITNGRGGLEPNRKELNFKTARLKECARIDFYRGVCSDDYQNDRWVIIWENLPKYRQIVSTQQDPSSEERVGDAVETVVGISYTAFMNGHNLPENHDFEWPDEECRVAWDHVFTALMVTGIKVFGNVPVRHTQSIAPPALATLVASALDSSSDEPAHKDLINSLLQFLWNGPQFHCGAKDYSEKDRFHTAGKRLAENIQWIREIRDEYAPSYVSRPVPVDHIFRRDEVSAMHNDYRNSLCWMPDHVRDKYYRLQAEAEAEQQSKRKGRNSPGWCKRGAKPKTTAELAHNCKKGTFNVCFFKSFGSKQLFWHLVKVGPDTPDLHALLHKWDEIRNSEGNYKRLVAASERKTEEVAVLKRLYVLRKKEMLLNQWRYAPKEKCEASAAAYETAKQEWLDLDRNTQNQGMHELFDAEDF